MTVSSTGSRDIKLGNGVTTVFSTSFAFLDDTDLVVTLVEADGTQVAKVLNTDYTVSGGDGSTGSVTTTTFTPQSGEELVIQREIPYLQGIDYIANDPFPAESAEEGLDRLTYLVQQVLDLTDRSLKTGINVDLSSVSTILPDPTGDFFLKWNAAGDALENATAPSAATTPFAATILDDTSGAEVLTTLGVTSYAQTILDDATAGDVLDTLGITSYAQTILDDATAGDVLDTLGITSYAQTILDDADAATARTTLGAAALGSNNTFSANNFFNQNVTFSGGFVLTQAAITIIGDDLFVTRPAVHLQGNSSADDNLDGMDNIPTDGIVLIQSDSNDEITIRHNETTGDTPFNLPYGRDLRLPPDPNTHFWVRNDGSFLRLISAPKRPGAGALVNRNTNQSIPNATVTVVNWDAEQYDTSAIHNTVTNNSRLTVPKGWSLVRVTASWAWASNNTGIRFHEILLNGVAAQVGVTVDRKQAATESEGMISTPLMEVSPGDYFEFQVFQDSGGSLNLAQGTRLWFAMELID